MWSVKLRAVVFLALNLAVPSYAIPAQQFDIVGSFGGSVRTYPVDVDVGLGGGSGFLEGPGLGFGPPPGHGPLPDSRPFPAPGLFPGSLLEPSDGSNPFLRPDQSSGFIPGFNAPNDQPTQEELMADLLRNLGSENGPRDRPSPFPRPTMFPPPSHGPIPGSRPDQKEKFIPGVNAPFFGPDDNPTDEERRAAFLRIYGFVPDDIHTLGGPVFPPSSHGPSPFPGSRPFPGSGLFPGPQRGPRDEPSPFPRPYKNPKFIPGVNAPFFGPDDHPTDEERRAAYQRIFGLVPDDIHSPSIVFPPSSHGPGPFSGPPQGPPPASELPSGLVDLFGPRNTQPERPEGKSRRRPSPGIIDIFGRPRQPEPPRNSKFGQISREEFEPNESKGHGDKDRHPSGLPFIGFHPGGDQ